MKGVLLIHGGAGTLFAGKVSQARENAARKGLSEALDAGLSALTESSLSAVTEAVKVLENCPVFNAGRGAVYSHAGQQEMDAAIMDGKNLEAGAIAGVKGIKNPIELAHKVLTESAHILLIGQGAEDFARLHQVRFENPEYFHSDYRWQQLQHIRDKETVALDHGLGDFSSNKDNSFGTVGAVACDLEGHLAAATSTGGMTNKRFGRVGDSPLIGIGNYANNDSCAVSCTGHGEYFIRLAMAYDVAARIRYQGVDISTAAQASLARLDRLNGGGGLIAVDSSGHWTMPFNTGRMYRGMANLNGKREISLYD